MANALLAKKQGHQMKQRRKDLIFVLCMLVIPFANFLVFWLWPNFQSIVIAFTLPGEDGFTLFNFQRFFGYLADPVTAPGIWTQIANSFILFGVGTFINIPLVLFLSYIMFKKIAGYKVFRVLFYLPSILGATVMTAIYKNIMAVNGPVHNLLLSMGVSFDSHNGLMGSPETGMLMMVIYTLWTGVGTNMIMFSGAMNRVPQDIFESARIDGIGFFREFFNIIVPLIWPTVTTMVVFSMVGIFSNSGIVVLMFGEAATEKVSNIGYYILRFTLHANETSSNIDKFCYPAAVGLIFTAVNLPLVFGTKALCDKIGKDAEY